MSLLNNISNFYHPHAQTFKAKDEMAQYRCRDCNKNLTANNPASIYQRQKIIQNTVRVKSSLYTMNLAVLSSYQPPSNEAQLINNEYIVPPNVYWNQMSDRAKPGQQHIKNTSNASSTRHTITRHRPGALSPGGNGVDIKHNYYGRYLNKLKDGPLKRDTISSNFEFNIPFNNANPIYGGKVIKLSIINCNCNNTKDNLKLVYSNPSNALQDEILAVKYEFKIGDYVYVRKNEEDTKLYKGIIINIENGIIYTVKFVDDNIIRYNLSYNDLIIYFNCDCNETIPVY